jgi:hypothetical protein
MRKRTLAIIVVCLLAAATAVAARPVSGPSTLTAVVAQDGHLAYGTGAVSARATGTDGSYVVTFDRDVSHCTYVAAAGDYVGDNYAGPDDAITVGAAPYDQDANSVYLLEYDAILGYDWSSSGLHLIVVC